MEKREQSLADRLKAGDSAAAAELVDIYYQRIYLFMRRLGHSYQVSEDLTQESFLQAWQHIDQLREDKSLDSWLYRIAGNVSKYYWRRHNNKEIVGVEEIEAPEGVETDYDKVAEDEQLSWVKKAVARLPVKLRHVVVLHYMQQLTIAEAAEAVGVREGTFKSRLNRALKALRKQIAREEQEL